MKLLKICVSLSLSRLWSTLQCATLRFVYKKRAVILMYFYLYVCAATKYGKGGQNGGISELVVQITTLFTQFIGYTKCYMRSSFCFWHFHSCCRRCLCCTHSSIQCPLWFPSNLRWNCAARERQGERGSYSPSPSINIVWILMLHVSLELVLFFGHK